ncbi:partitioning protein ParB (plasmid) [Dinoroseobacter shibae DFL 12 = DSM 16493]|jgi:ParB family chromosome partitioning protein|uniref:Partitioning protein ParB n=1 Tax=Dinoroseobacter shibae (strain DSM 16493 / NCIMB 14021 / DFL 12) TaxID=398580 RepID=A8LUK5_DINSH|nr:ParB N-terminal domain-containing protein [Dinoroseobacter shibae]ABV95922.1 partitioning protein ParB [Dinoroseobacter shibae DFL 12 = DSM 16493]URF49164.1 ParB N-terminal domain-containing protein [Dinoroseobacter shibae]URF53472.1 ParB N-terminal domain-containing protein [Dinoroseobacter shibae]
MAKRRRLETPSAEDLTKIADEIRAETPLRPAAPIAQVAADAASLASTMPPQARAEAAQDKADAERLRAAQADGLLLAEVPTAEIDADAMVRDRMVLNDEELTELRLSIAENGLRLPIEVFELSEPRDGRRFGLLSGYRRLMAYRGLAELNPKGRYRAIKAVVRPRQAIDKAYAAMVEENEVRAALSHYERGRIAVIAANQGAFTNVEEAVERLFSSASRAKRSKVRSFAIVFEELGDMLAFPEALTERRGLQLATALRAGAERRIREVLEAGAAKTPEEEWAFLDAVISEIEEGPRTAKRGGRPKLSVPAAGWHGRDTLQTSTGVTIRRETDGRGHILRLEGKRVTPDAIETIMLQIRDLLEAEDKL